MALLMLPLFSLLLGGIGAFAFRAKTKFSAAAFGALTVVLVLSLLFLRFGWDALGYVVPIAEWAAPSARSEAWF